MKEIAPNVYVSTEYPYVNVGCVVGSEGVVALDAPTLPEDAVAWRERIGAVTGKPIVYTALTDVHPHRLLCAGLLEAPLVASRAAYQLVVDYTQGYWRNVIRRLSKEHPEQESTLTDMEPTLPEILFNQALTLHKGGAQVTIERVDGAAPGSAWVQLPDRNVVFVGDTLVVGRPPIMEATPDTRAWLHTLTELRRPRYSGATLVPGRGPLSDQAETEALSEYIRVARRRMRSLHRQEDPREEPADFTAELLSLFALSEEERQRFRRRVRNGLKQVHAELSAEAHEGE